MAHSVIIATPMLSDLSGTDPNVHGGTVEGAMRELCNAFVLQPPRERTTVDEMMKTYRTVSGRVEEILRKTRAKSLFEKSVFKLLYSTAVNAAFSPYNH